MCVYVTSSRESKYMYYILQFSKRMGYHKQHYLVVQHFATASSFYIITSLTIQRSLSTAPLPHHPMVKTMN